MAQKPTVHLYIACPNGERRDVDLHRVIIYGTEYEFMRRTAGCFLFRSEYAFAKNNADQIAASFERFNKGETVWCETIASDIDGALVSAVGESMEVHESGSVAGKYRITVLVTFKARADTKLTWGVSNEYKSRK